jgi:hypothetical protein
MLCFSILIEFSLLLFFNTTVRGVTVIKAKKEAEILRPSLRGLRFEKEAKSENSL